VHRLDSITLDSSYFTDEGYFFDEPVVTSVGIFEYKNPDNSIRRELRLPEHVFDPESLASYEGKPVIITHDAGRVDKNNVEREIVGTMLSPGYKDGEDVRCKVIIHGIQEVQRSGLRELSLGYDLSLDETPGEWKGQHYDAIQTEIRINHLALVGDARAGDQARLNLDGNDQSLKGAKRMAKGKAISKAMSSEELSKVLAAKQLLRKTHLDAAEFPAAAAEEETNEDSMLTGEVESPEIAEKPADSIDFIRQRRDRRDEDGPPESLEEALAQILQQDEDIDALFDIVEELTAQKDFDNAMPEQEEKTDEDKEDEDEIVDVEKGKGEVTLTIQTDAMDAVVRERLKLGRLGDKLNLDGLEDMKPIDAKKAIVKKVNPNMRLDGKSSAYVNAAFDAAVAQIGTTGGWKDVGYQRKQMSNRTRTDGTDFAPTGKTAASRAREKMINRMMNGGTEE
jgi:hypothetical protein